MMAQWPQGSNAPSLATNLLPGHDSGLGKIKPIIAYSKYSKQL